MIHAITIEAVLKRLPALEYLLCTLMGLQAHRQNKRLAQVGDHLLQGSKDPNNGGLGPRYYGINGFPEQSVPLHPLHITVQVAGLVDLFI